MRKKNARPTRTVIYVLSTPERGAVRRKKTPNKGPFTHISDVTVP